MLQELPTLLRNQLARGRQSWPAATRLVVSQRQEFREMRQEQYVVFSVCLCSRLHM